MNDTPKFEVIDRRKLKAQQEEQETEAQGSPSSQPSSQQRPAQPSTPQAAQPKSSGPVSGQTSAPASVHGAPPVGSGPRLVEESRSKSAPAAAPAGHREHEPGLPPAPSAQESKEQKAAYDASAQRIEEMARAQNPGMGAQPPLTFEHLIQQFYLSGLIQMGVGAQHGERAQIDILGARNTIDMLGLLAEKTRGNLTPAEDRMLQSILYELRMMFLEITGMISMPSVQPPPSVKR